MTANTHILLSGALTFGVPIVLAIGQLVSLRRPPRGDGGRPPPPAEPPRPKPLPDCLIPKRLPTGPALRRRVLEDA